MIVYQDSHAFSSVRRPNVSSQLRSDGQLVPIQQKKTPIFPLDSRPPRNFSEKIPAKNMSLCTVREYIIQQLAARSTRLRVERLSSKANMYCK